MYMSIYTSICVCRTYIWASLADQWLRIHLKKRKSRKRERFLLLPTEEEKYCWVKNDIQNYNTGFPET